MWRTGNVKRILAFATLVLLVSCSDPSTTESNKFIGSWRLISWVASTENGEVFPFGDNPYGVLIYQPNGYMTVSLMKEGRSRISGNDPLSSTTSDMVYAFQSFFSYSGLYTINEDESLIEHSVTASTNPNWVGGTQKRSFEFKYGQLVLKTPVITSNLTSKSDAIHTLIWKRF